jgi:o-succinylbenzoate synthase
MIEIRPYTLPLRTEYRWGKGSHWQRCGFLVRVDLGGAVGWGESAREVDAEVPAEALAAEGRALVDGLDPRAPDFLEALDRRAPNPRMRSGIATAWLSARAVRKGVSLGWYLAGDGPAPATAVPVNALITEKEPEDAARRALELAETGFQTFKIKCTSNREENIWRVAAIREALPRARLRLDANESWEPGWSLEHLRQLARFEIEYVEQPLPRHSPLDDLVAYRAASPVRVALDESAQDHGTIATLLDAGAADVIILKTLRVGGPDRARDVIRLVASRGKQCTVTASLETAIGITTAVHVASLLPQPLPDCGLGLARFFQRDVAEPPPIVDARITVPTGPGLGLEVTSLSSTRPIA